MSGKWPRGHGAVNHRFRHRRSVGAPTLLQREGVAIDGKVYGCMIAFLSEHRMELLALKLETAIRESDIEMDTRLYNLLLNAASYVGGPSLHATRVHAYACFELYGQMLEEGQRPNIVTLNILIIHVIPIIHIMVIVR